MENTHNFFIPKTNLIGIGSIKDLTNELLSWKFKKALLVVDKNMLSLGYVEKVQTILKNLFISYDIFDGVLHPNATVTFVENGLSHFTEGIPLLHLDYSLIISIGGGTNHDCAKAIAAVATNGGSIIDYEGYNKVTKPGLPHIAINTTAGSGAEITMFTIITDESRRVKMSIASPNTIPFISVNDPLFMPTMPQEITASSGIDALSHAIEAYCATESSPITDVLALDAIRIVFLYLPRAYENGHDMKAREQMMYANVMAGMAFNNAGLGYVHALAHQLGGFYGQTHGCYNAVLLPHVFNFNSNYLAEERILAIAEAIGISADNKTQAVEQIFAAIKKLATTIGLPEGLAAMGVQIGDLDLLAGNALKDIAGLTNPGKGTLEDVINIYKAAM
ncbi:MAG: iron-containing alcohol dehydrogenase [Pelosinus sp.]|nr:iron-containing alcohol dehydrogenase [Pelosinus sp.]